ncbi:MAG: hypothetical protein JHC26_08805 [Thermofilum sp.]|jgi:hypothetical protein|uniref:hypothetical protein n=1 Tax=Thermofilum sp. TaxID=1961369 RepID=UPI002587E0CB|nr:hypothetical protein [Thermofilum sp.]MCI4409177.1 hypothetical protein [Thermofilum sp.]
MDTGMKITVKTNYLLATKVDVVAYDPESKYEFVVKFDLYHYPTEPQKAKLFNKTYGSVDVSSKDDIAKAIETLVGRKFIVREIIIG